MENLSDDLLIEIWSRVSYKTAVSCKSISKRFLALISQLQFIERSILHHHTLLQQMKEEENQKKWHFNFISKRKLLISFSPNLNVSTPEKQISLSFLGRKFDPKLDNKQEKNMSCIRELSDFQMACFSARKPHVVESTMYATSSQKIGSNFHSLHRRKPVTINVTVYSKALFVNLIIALEKTQRKYLSTITGSG